MIPRYSPLDILFMKQIVLLNCNEIGGIHIGVLYAIPCGKAGHR